MATIPGVAVVGHFEDGSLLRQVTIRPDDPVLEEGVVQDQAAFVRFGRDGADIDTVARVSGNESVRVIEAIGSGAGATGYPRPFGSVRLASVLGRSVATTGGFVPEIQVFEVGGQLTRLIRIDRGWPYRHRFLDAIPAGPYRQRAERAVGGESFPEWMPAFEALRFDRAGNLWAADYRAVSAEPTAWNVFGAEGTWLSVVNTPAGLRVTDIGENYVLGVARDSVDVEHVHLYELRKTPTVGGS